MQTTWHIHYRFQSPHKLACCTLASTRTRTKWVRTCLRRHPTTPGNDSSTQAFILQRYGIFVSIRKCSCKCRSIIPISCLIHAQSHAWKMEDDDQIASQHQAGHLLLQQPVLLLDKRVQLSHGLSAVPCRMEEFNPGSCLQSLRMRFNLMRPLQGGLPAIVTHCCPCCCCHHMLESDPCHVIILLSAPTSLFGQSFCMSSHIQFVIS